MMLATRPSLTRLSLSRRSVHTSTDDTRHLLRELLRETAQSVAVVTALLPADPARHPSTPASTPTYHGATLSSFTSIALDPLPLVAFSLRVPSRMASALNTHVSSSQPPPSHSPPAHLIINILSAAQPHLAHRFARPDLHHHPFQDPRVPYTPSPDGLPILSGALGALSCRLVGPSLPLAHLRGSQSHAFDNEPAAGPSVAGGEEEVQQVSARTGLASELFIARVVRVERVPPLEDGEQDGTGLHRLPLLYHRRRYTTVGES